MIAVSLNVGGGVRLIKPAKLCMCTQTLQTQRGRTHGAGCVRQWFRTAEPLGERRYENWNTHTHFHTDAKGKDLSKLINNYNLTILNDGTPTMADFATAPDLTLATTEMSPHTTWNPINQSCGSEHLPILISLQCHGDVQ